MSAREEISLLTRELAHLNSLSHPVEATRTGLDAALHARGAALAVTAQVLTDVHHVPLARTPRVATIEHLVDIPEHLFVRAARAHGSLQTEHSPTDVAASARPGSTTGHWVAMAVAASAAHHHWTASPKRPTGDAALSAAADVSVVALGFAHLDARLAQAARRLGADDVVTGLDAARGAGLHLAAEQAFARATSSGTGWDAAAPPGRSGLTAHPVGGVGELPAALAHLRKILDNAPSVTPGQIAMLLTAQVRMSAVLARHAVLDARAGGGARSTDLAGALEAHARALTGAWGRSDRGLVSLVPGERAPVQQAGECVRALSAAPRLSNAQLHRLAGLVLDLAPVTSTCVQARMRTHKWVTLLGHDDDLERVSWRFVSPSRPAHVAVALRYLPPRPTALGSGRDLQVLLLGSNPRSGSGNSQGR